MSNEKLATTLGLIINQYTDTFLKMSRGAIKILSTISEEPFINIVDRKLFELENIDADFREVCEEDGSILWNFSLERTKKRHKLKGNFLALQSGKSVYLITGQPTEFLNDGLFYLARKMYPELIMPYITSEEIQEILESFSKIAKVELFYSKFVVKKMFGKAFTGIGFATKREPEAYDSYTEAFSDARSRGLWIDTIRVFSKSAPIDFSISRSGLLKYYRGTFETYYNLLLSKIWEFYTQKLKHFENRGRRVQPKKEPNPLLIKFDSNVFEDIAVRKQLVKVIGNYDFCSYSVIYGGNPHVYMSIVDRVDNSSFSLRTYGPNSIVIVPQVKSTKAALMRFSKHLLDSFREGVISDFAG